MNDPRMAAFGGVGALRPRLLQKMAPVPDAGGYRVPTSEMRQMFNMPRPNLRKMDVPTGERGVRSDYVGTVQALNEDVYAADSAFSPERLDQVRQGLKAITQDPQREGPPNPEMMRRFGFDGAQQRAEIDKIRREARRDYIAERPEFGRRPERGG
jgi:hypothetical protein